MESFTSDRRPSLVAQLPAVQSHPSFAMELSYLPTGPLDVWPGSGVSWGVPSTCGSGASAPLVSPLPAVRLSRVWREYSVSLRGRPQGERVRNTSRKRLARVLGTHGFVPVGFRALHSWCPRFRGGKLTWSQLGWLLSNPVPCPPRWTCSRSSWALRAGSTSATSCGTASRPLRRFRPSRCSGRHARAFFIC